MSWFLGPMLKVSSPNLETFTVILDYGDATEYHLPYPFQDDEERDLDWSGFDKRLSLLRPSRGLILTVHASLKDSDWNATWHYWARAIQECLPRCVGSGLLHTFSVGSNDFEPVICTRPIRDGT